MAKSIRDTLARHLADAADVAEPIGVDYAHADQALKDVADAIRERGTGATTGYWSVCEDIADWIEAGGKPGRVVDG